MDLALCDLPVGTVVWTCGDICNPSGYGRVVAHCVVEGAWGRTESVEVRMHDPEEEPRTLLASAFSRVYEGHSGTRWVTAAAYLEWRNRERTVMEGPVQQVRMRYGVDGRVTVFDGVAVSQGRGPAWVRGTDTPPDGTARPSAHGVVP